MAKQINPQGYNYGKNPTNSNPFWSESETAEKLTASASVDDTTGTPEVSVSTTGYNVDFKFSGLKGERGEKGEQGIQGVQGEPGVQGNPGVSGKDGKNGYNVTMDATGSKQSGTISTILYGYTMENGEYKSQTSYVYNGERGERGEKGEQGEPGVAGKDGKDGKDADISSCVTDISVTNENGKYTIKQTKGTGTGATESEVGSIAMPDTNNLLAEITDSVTENTVDGFDHHVIKETENNGTQNDVGNFYIARKQITDVRSATVNGYWTDLGFLNFMLDTVDQSGAKESDKGTQIVRLADLTATFPEGSISVESNDKCYIIICNLALKYNFTDIDGTVYNQILGYGDSILFRGTPIICEYNSDGDFLSNICNLVPYSISGMFLTSTQAVIYPYDGKKMLAYFNVMGNKNQEITVMNTNNQSKKVTLKDIKFSLDEVSVNNVIQYKL